MMSRRVPFFTSVRFYASLFSTAVLNLRVFGLSLRSTCSPAMNCHGCPWSTSACPVGVMTYGSAVHAIPAMVLGLILTTGILGGRLVCAFACPFGLLQDLLHRIPGPKFRMWRFWNWGRYATLVLLVFLLPWLSGISTGGFLSITKPKVDKAEGGLKVVVTVANQGTEPVRDPSVELAYRATTDGRELPETFTTVHTGVSVPPGETLALPAVSIPNKLGEANLVARSPQAMITQRINPLTYYCKLCPVGTLESTLPALAGNGGGMYGGDLLLRLGILGGFLVAMWLWSRPFCRTFCPLGAIYSLTNRLSWSRIEADESKCTQCGACAKACPMDLELPGQVGNADCIQCGDCIRACPEMGIRRRFGLR